MQKNLFLFNNDNNFPPFVIVGGKLLSLLKKFAYFNWKKFES